jgi:hypothetical protein
VTVSTKKLTGRNRGGGGVSDSGSSAAVAAVAAAEAEAKIAADWGEEHKGDDDDDDDGEGEDEVTAAATAGSTNKRRRVSFSGATTAGSGGGSSGRGVDARFASTRSSMGGTVHAHDHIHTRTQQTGGTITTPMSTRKRARLEKHALDDISYSCLQQEELEELFSRVRHNRSKVVCRENSSGCIHLNHTNHHFSSSSSSLSHHTTTQVVERTLAGGANPDARDVHGNTMLHVAAQNNLLKVTD